MFLTKRQSSRKCFRSSIGSSHNIFIYKSISIIQIYIVCSHLEHEKWRTFIVICFLVYFCFEFIIYNKGFLLYIFFSPLFMMPYILTFSSIHPLLRGYIYIYIFIYTYKIYLFIANKCYIKNRSVSAYHNKTVEIKGFYLLNDRDIL